MTHDDCLVWARTIAGEARGESLRGQLAVTFVPLNRSRLSYRTVVQECLKRWQFSCWNKKDANRAFIEAMTEKELEPFLTHVYTALTGVVDPSNHATFYHVKGITPIWSIKQLLCAVIGHHIFYGNIAPYKDKMLYDVV